jgi:RHS repeat-associated protein
MRQQGQDYQYLYDGKGNVTAVIDSNQNPVATYAYDEFGKVASKTGTLDQPFQFSTKFFDNETGLNYYGYRFYSAALGRWINRDPLEEEGGINLYAFVENDPINLVDFWGLQDRTPASGPPNTTQRFPNKTGWTDRVYGEDGRATKDVDFGHDHGGGDPHVHDWDWSKEKPRQDGRAPAPEDEANVSKPKDDKADKTAKSIAIGLGGVGAGYLIYRGIRMLPSLIPALWPTIIINATCP